MECVSPRIKRRGSQENEEREASVTVTLTRDGQTSGSRYVSKVDHLELEKYTYLEKYAYISKHMHIYNISRSSPTTGMG